jgi:hypothetical protein
MKKKIKPTCEHIDFDNKRDCKNKAEYICLCCGVPVCQEHKTKECPYGGMGFIEI